MSGTEAANTVSELRLQIASLEEKNLRLGRALKTARDQMQGLQEQLERIHRPPAQLATFVAGDVERGEICAHVGNRTMYLAVAPELKIQDLSPGQQIRLDAEMIAVEAAEFPREGLLGSVLELLGTDRVLVGLGPGQEQVMNLAAPLRHGRLKPGESVICDLKSGFAFERVVRSDVEQLLTPETPDVTYADIGGLDSQIELVRDAVELPFKHPELYRAYGLRAPKGILLYGPPGCGKTLIAKAVAASLSNGQEGKKTYFISIKGPELLNKFVGETERQIRAIFARARTLASGDVPVVVFFDEMEALFRTRGSGVSSDVETMIVPQLLAEMDGLESLENVIIIGASNRADMIDPAVLRPGRLDVRVRVNRPSRQQAKDIFAKYLTADLPIAEDLLTESGSPEQAITQMTEAALDSLYAKDESTSLFDLYLADDTSHRVYLADLVSGAMISGTVERAKKHAIKDSLSGAKTGLAIQHVLAGVKEEMRESVDLAATTSPDEWARVIGLRGAEVTRVTLLEAARD